MGGPGATIVVERVLSNNLMHVNQESTQSSKQPIRTRYLGHVTGNQPIRDQYFMVRSVPDVNQVCTTLSVYDVSAFTAECRDNRGQMVE